MAGIVHGWAMPDTVQGWGMAVTVQGLAMAGTGPELLTPHTGHTAEQALSEEPITDGFANRHT